MTDQSEGFFFIERISLPRGKQRISYGEQEFDGGSRN